MKIEVKHIMKELPTRLNSADFANKAIMILSENTFRHLPVVEGKEVVGMVSVFDLIRIPLEEASNVPVSEVMTTPAKVLLDTDEIEKVVDAFTNAGMHSMPVVNKHNQLVGMLSSGDIIHHLSDELNKLSSSNRITINA